ncbi:MAG: helix-turn-helix transcriptional regulator [Burkholderiaceae bacterium]
MQLLSVPARKHGRSAVVRIQIIALEAICRHFDCQPGDLLAYVPDDAFTSPGEVG